MKKANIVVIGGGIIGTSVAYHLVEMGGTGCAVAGQGGFGRE